LVVIAIIAILASILFPVFESARENARKTACLSNLKQMGIGVLQYEQDFDEYLPLATFYNNGQEQYVWMDAIYPYIKNTQILPVPASPPL
jgi:type II secretory pathway pseudopilin PulG